MNIGVTREAEGLERRVALTPSVARQLVDQKHTVWVEKGAGERAMIPDEEYIRAGAQIAYTQPEVIRRSELVVQVSAPAPEQLEHFSKDTVVMAFSLGLVMAVVGAAAPALRAAAIQPVEAMRR